MSAEAAPVRAPRRSTALILVGVLAAVLAVGALVALVAVVEAVRSLANAYIFPPPLASDAWVAGIYQAVARERALGLAVPALAAGAGLVAVIALATSAIRRGRGVLTGRLLLVPAALGAALLVGAAVALRAPAPTVGANDVTGLLFSAQARGGQSTATGLGLAGILVLALVAGRLAVDSRPLLIGTALAAVALGVAVVPAIGAAVQPILDALRGPSYPAQSLIPDAHASALAVIAATGAGAFAIAAVVALVVRMRVRPARSSAVPAAGREESAPDAS